MRRERINTVAQRVVLAYSGGLDTSVAVHWLRVERDYEVIAVAVDVGQGSDFDAIRERALCTRVVTRSCRRSRAPSSCVTSSRKHVSTARMRSRTAAPAKATTRCG